VRKEFQALKLVNAWMAAIQPLDQLERLEFFPHANLPAVHNRLEEIRSEPMKFLPKTSTTTKWESLAASASL